MPDFPRGNRIRDNSAGIQDASRTGSHQLSLGENGPGLVNPPEIECSDHFFEVKGGLIEFFSANFGLRDAVNGF
jgi:hypothetical protein